MLKIISESSWNQEIWKTFEWISLMTDANKSVSFFLVIFVKKENSGISSGVMSGSNDSVSQSGIF